MGRKIWGIFVVCLLALPAMAADEPDPFNVDFSIGWGDCYRPLEWTPVEVGVATSLKEPFGGTMIVSADQDSMTQMVVRHKMVVTRDAPIRVPLVVRLSYSLSSCKLTIEDEKGSARFEQDYGIRRSRPGGSRFTMALRNGDYLVGVVGRKGFGLGKLDENSSGSSGGKVYVKDKAPAVVPWDWTGYKSLDMLVLYNPEWELISQNQAKAIHEYVSNGGRCLIVLGSRGIPATSPIADMLPFKLSEPRTVKVNEKDLKYESTLSRSGTVTAWGVGENRDASPEWFFDKLGTPQPLLAWGPHGYGKVAVLTFDPSELPEAKQVKSARFWVTAMNQIDRQEKRINFQTGVSKDDNDYRRYPGYYYGESTRDATATNQVLGHLLDIPEMRPLSIWWVIGLLAVLALLLGPIDYMVLKKFDRLPLTWITSACIIAMATVGAYYGVQALRAGSMQVRAVTIVDVLQESADKNPRSPEAWSTSYCGIFAPASDRYRFTGLAGCGWWSAASPVEQYYYGGRGLASRQIFCSQQDGGNLPQEVPINIWSMQCMVNESAVDSPPLSAEVRLEGRNKIVAKITNSSKSPIVWGLVRVGGREFEITRVEPGATQTFAGSPTGSSAPRRLIARNLDPETIGGAYGCWQRTVAMSERLQDGKNALVCVRFENAPLPYQVVPKDYKVDHIMIARLMVPVSKDGE